jgi:hypothetical protein
MIIKKISIFYLILMAAFQQCNAMLTEHIKQKELEQTVRYRIAQKVKAGKVVVSNSAQGSGHLIAGAFSASGWSSACCLGCFYASSKAAKCVALSSGAKTGIAYGCGCAGGVIGCCVGIKLAEDCFASAKERFNQAMAR